MTTHSAALGERLEGMLQAHGVPGCSLAFQLDGEVQSLSYGYADVLRTRPVRDETVFHLYSGTKLYTATALMILVEGRQVYLGQSAQELLPELQLRFPISLRELASHQSGLRDTLRAFLAVHLPGERPPTTGEALARYRTTTGVPPGRKAVYRNINYAILGEVIARTAGVSFEDYVAQAILTPLKTRATFSYDDVPRSAVAQGTIGRWSPFRALLRLLMPDLKERIEANRQGSLVGLTEFTLDSAPIGGLLGCARDFLPLAVEMLDQEDGLLTASSKRSMLTVHASGQCGIASRLGVGIGWKLGEQGGVRFWNHEGGGPGFTSETRVYPAEKLAVVILMNATHRPRLSWLAHEMCELIRRGT